jgi:hypothetical protein
MDSTVCLYLALAYSFQGFICGGYLTDWARRKRKKHPAVFFIVGFLFGFIGLLSITKLPALRKVSSKDKVKSGEEPKVIEAPQSRPEVYEKFKPEMSGNPKPVIKEEKSFLAIILAISLLALLVAIIVSLFRT